MVLNKFTGSTIMDGTEKSLFKIVGTTMKHFASYVYLKALQAGESIRLRVYNKVDDVSHWKLDGDVTDSVNTNNGTITNIASWVSQWKFDGDVLDSVGSNNGTITYNTNLKTLYKFESNVNDSTTNAANGTVTGTTTFVTGREGKAFSFDGSTYITNSFTYPVGTNDRSVSFWIYPTSFVNGATIFDYGSTNANQLFALQFTGTAGKLLAVGFSNDVTSNGSLQLNTWNYVTLTLGSAGTVRTIYINGVQDTQSTTTALNTVTGNNIRIGADISNSNKLPSGTLLDEFRIYSIAVTQDQVNSLYMNGKFGQSHIFDQGESIATTVSPFNWERTQPFSVSVWYKSNESSVNESVIGNQQGGSFTGRGWGIWIESDGNTVDFNVCNTDATNILRVRCFPTLKTNTWHHIVVTYDGSSTPAGVLMYIDGVSQSVSTVLNTLSATSVSTSALTIGSLPTQTGGFLIGQLDEVRVYSAVLSQSRVTALYNYPGSNYITPLPVGNALSLDGSSYVTIPNETPYHWERTQAFTIAFWVKSSSMPAQSTMYYKFSGGGAGHLYILNVSGYPQLLIRNTPTTNDLNVQTNNNVIDGTWHNVIVTYDGSSNASNVKFYIDGVLKTTTVNSNTLSATVVNTIQPVLGAQTGGGNPYTGLLDEVQIYNYVVSSAEINAINAGRFANTHPIGLWHFDGDLYDYSGQGSTGSPTGNVTYVTGALSGSYNVPNTHFYFDGSIYVNTGNPSALGFDIQNPFTISFWMNNVSVGVGGSDFRMVIGKNPPGITGGKGWGVYVDNGGFLNFEIGNTTSNWLRVRNNSSTTPVDNLWHLYTVTYDGSGKAAGVTWYVDGVSATGGTLADSATIGITATNSNNVELGGVGTGNPTYVGTFELDDIRVYNRKLSAAEVSDLFTYPDSQMKSLVYDKTYTGLVSDAKFAVFLPENQYMITAQQLSGINRIISWQRQEVT